MHLRQGTRKARLPGSTKSPEFVSLLSIAKRKALFPGIGEGRQSREETWKLVEFYKTALGSRTWTKAAAKLLNTKCRSQPEGNAKEE